MRGSRKTKNRKSACVWGHHRLQCPRCRRLGAESVAVNHQSAALRCFAFLPFPLFPLLSFFSLLLSRRVSIFSAAAALRHNFLSNAQSLLSLFFSLSIRLAVVYFFFFPLCLDLCLWIWWRTRCPNGRLVFGFRNLCFCLLAYWNSLVCLVKVRW